MSEAGGRGRGDDRARLLAQRSEVGYTDDQRKALRDEPEAVSLAEQRAITERVQRAERRRKLTAWVAARQMMLDGAATAEAALGGDVPRREGFQNARFMLRLGSTRGSGRRVGRAA